MEFSWIFFIDHWFWILLGSFMLFGGFFNYDHLKKTRRVEGAYDRIENPTATDRVEMQLQLTRIDNHSHREYITFWLFCITIILVGILVTLSRTG
jgi:hypothetical protein